MPDAARLAGGKWIENKQMSSSSDLPHRWHAAPMAARPLADADARVARVEPSIAHPYLLRPDEAIDEAREYLMRR